MTQPTTSYTLAPASPEVREQDRDREQLILTHLPQVKLIASRIHDKLPESVCLDDLVSVGVLGLIEAVDKFDPSLNVKLKTYAEHKIRGAILDSLRSLDWAPRNKRRKAKLIEAAIQSGEKKLHRTPVEEEVAAELNVSLEDYRRWLVEVRGINLAPIEPTPRGPARGVAPTGKGPICFASFPTLKKSGPPNCSSVPSSNASWPTRSNVCPTSSGRSSRSITTRS